MLVRMELIRHPTWNHPGIYASHGVTQGGRHGVTMEFNMPCSCAWCCPGGNPGVTQPLTMESTVSLL